VLTAATALGDSRHVAYAQYRLGEVAEAEGRFAAAAEAYAAALPPPRAAGPPNDTTDAAAAPLAVRWLRPEVLLLALGHVRRRQADGVGAERAYTDALAEGGWPGEVPYRGMTLAMTACSCLCTLYDERGDAVRRDARLRQWRALLDAAGVGAPSDTHAVLAYELACLQYGTAAPSAAAAAALLARARRVHPHPATQLGIYLRACACMLDQASAVAALEQALALARADRAADAHASRVDTRRTLVLLARTHLSVSPPGDAVPTPAAKTAALRAYAQAAACFAPDDNARSSVEFAELLEAVVHVSRDPVAQGIPEIRIALPRGREVSLHEPDGLGRIALCEEAMRIRTVVQGAQSPALIPHLMALGMLLHQHCDVKESAAVMERAARLAAATLGEAHATTRNARALAATAATNLATVLSRIRLPAPYTVQQVSRRNVQRAMLEMYAHNVLGQSPLPPGQRAGESEAAFLRRHAEESLARARRASDACVRHDPPCAGCGAVRDRDAAHFKRCATCNAVAYCGVACQRAHWKRVHKRECATLAGGAGAAGGGSGSGGGGGGAAGVQAA
jgi:hypothetical protein